MARTKDPELEQQRSREITDAVIAALEDGSWRSVTLSEVAERAGVSKGVVTYWFDSKDAMLLAAIARFHERYAVDLLGIAAAPIHVRDRLERLIEAALPSRDVVVREIRFQTELWSYAKEHPEVRAAVAEAYGHFRAACEALLQIGIREGYVTTPDTDDLYFFVHALIDGVTLHVAFDASVDLPKVRRQLLVQLERWLTAPGSAAW